MKKFLSVLLSALLAVSLAACKQESSPNPFSPDSDAQTLLDSGPFTEALTHIDTEVACARYGIDPATVTAGAVYGSTGATAEELAAFAFGDEEGAKAALAALQGRVQDRKEEMADYLPAEVPKLDGAVAERRGASVLLVVAADYGPVRDFLEG